MADTSDKLRLVRPLSSSDETACAKPLVDPYLALARRLCQAMILVGERITTQRDFLKRSGVSRSSAFNLVQGRIGPNTPTPATITKLAAFCMDTSYVPWSGDVSTTVAESLMPALSSQMAWREWRRTNPALFEFARCSARPHAAQDEKTVTGAALIVWFVCLGDVCEETHVARASYHDACARLVDVLGSIRAGGPFVQYVQFLALHDQYVCEWNDIDWNRPPDDAHDRFDTFFRLLCEYIDAGNPTLVAEHVNVLAYASHNNMTDRFALLRRRLEEAWRRHNGSNAKPDYEDESIFKSEFGNFRKWLDSDS